MVTAPVTRWLGPLLALLLAPAAWGQGVIESNRIELQLLPDGDLLAVETLDVDFGTQAAHGIDREWLRDRIDAVGIVPWHINLFEVSQDGHPVSFSRQTLSGGGPALLRLRIGQPGQTLTGRHRYTLGYRVSEALSLDNDHLYLRWPVLGEGWHMPILHSEVTLSLPPSQAPLGTLRVELHPQNLPNPLREFTEDPTLPGWRIALGALAPGRGATLAGTFDPARFDPHTGFSPLSGLWPLLRSGWPWLLVLGLMLELWRRSGWFGLRPPPPIPVRYDLPQGVSAAEAGVVYDGYARFGDLGADAVTMAQRGVLTVHAPQHRRGRGIYLRRTPGSSWAGEPLYRQYLMSALFSEGSTYRPGKGDREGQIGSLKAAQQALYERTTERGWFAEHPMHTRDFARATLFLAALALLALGAWFSPIAVRDLGPVLVPSALLLAFLALDAPELHRAGLSLFHLHPALWLATLLRRVAVSTAAQAITRLFPASTPWLERTFQFMAGLALIEALQNAQQLHGTGWFWLIDPLIPAIVAALLLVGAAHFTTRWTPQGQALRTHLLGLKTFMERVDRDRLERMLRDDPAYLDKALPYAVMFGLGGRWGSLFEGLAPLPVWYQGAAEGSDLGRGLELLAVGLVTPLLDGSGGHGPKGGGGGIW